MPVERYPNVKTREVSSSKQIPFNELHMDPLKPILGRELILQNMEGQRVAPKIDMTPMVERIKLGNLDKK